MESLAIIFLVLVVSASLYGVFWRTRSQTAAVETIDEFKRSLQETAAVMDKAQTALTRVERALVELDSTGRSSPADTRAKHQARSSLEVKYFRYLDLSFDSILGNALDRDVGGLRWVAHWDLQSDQRLYQPEFPRPPLFERGRASFWTALALLQAETKGGFGPEHPLLKRRRIRRGALKSLDHTATGSLLVC
jgi:hypothetical protein